MAMQDAAPPPDAEASSASPPASAAELLRSPYAASLELFRSLPAPTVEEMRGEYRAELLDQGSPAWLWLASFFVHQRGLWLAKAFCPTGADRGHGYNLFLVRGRLRRGTRMRTFVAPSRLDGHPAYVLDYAPHNRGVLGTMRDEVRKIADGLYLGVGTVGWGRWMRRPSPFVLEGPVAAFAE